MDVRMLKSVGTIAFDGLTKNGLRMHPDQKHLVYPMGRQVTIKNIASGEQTYLAGHTNLISALCISVCGKFIATGQINHLGFKAMVIVWNYEERNVKGSHEIHKVRVEDLCFSRDSNYLISLGGRDDGNIVIWDVIKNEAVCGAFASNKVAGNALTIARTNNRDRCFVTAGDGTLKVWRIDPASRKVHGVNVKMGKLRRTINCVAIDERDENAYCGTSSGDVIRARLNYHRDLTHTDSVRNPIMVGCYSKIPKNLKKMKAGEGELYAGGVKVVLLLKDDRIIVGAGDGTVDLVGIAQNGTNVTNKNIKLPNAPRIQSYLTENVTGSITSIELLGNQFILVGTSLCEIYQLKLSNFDTRLLVTCHTSAIYDIAFPHNYSEVFATGSTNDIRLWHLETQKELLRITVPNFVCSSLCFSYDGKMIISAWNDGIIRAFAAQTGIPVFLIHSAHIKGASVVGVTKDGKKIISGGCDGQVRIWDIRPNAQRLFAVLKEHRGAVTSLHISRDDEQAISSSTDGTCIIWDLTLASRKQVLMGNTMYMSSRFSPNGVQVLTCGTDRKIAFWETLDGSMVREIEGSTAGSLNCLDIGPTGQHFITGSNDCIVKLWDYESAGTTHIGMGHAAIITGCKFSPDSRCIVTVSADGAIMIWKCPFVSTFEIIGIDKCPDSVATRSTCTIREEAWNKSRLNLFMDEKNVMMDTAVKSELVDSVKVLPKCKPAKPNTSCEESVSLRSLESRKNSLQLVGLGEATALGDDVRSLLSDNNSVRTARNSPVLHKRKSSSSNSLKFSMGKMGLSQNTLTSK